MKSLPLTDEWFFGAVSLEHTEAGIKPWRIPYQDYELYPPDGINGKAAICAGVRLRLRSDSTIVALSYTPLEDQATLDCIADGKLYSVKRAQGSTEVVFEGLPVGMKEIEIYLPQNIGLTISGLKIEVASQFEVSPDVRPKWVTYGSSITQCVAASSPSRTWPAIASVEGGYNLTCLGYSGNCHLEPMIARLIRDLPADVITLCVGINVYGAASLSPRTFKPALIGMLDNIREKHTTTPLFVISPIYGSEREVEENELGFTLPMMREDIRQTVELLQQRGDHHIFYRDGLEWFDGSDEEYLSDGLHPDAAGYELLGSRFMERIIQNNG
ncbi:SGNH/GDSL hydrolase family protein [Paenibacillus sp. FA6]|uniref:SGNH/GDSL hydrolase family protein n=1 Tax=Paenibacillus sp. FA6 TaxID=3413029 RepID=UPI003F655E57